MQLLMFTKENLEEIIKTSKLDKTIKNDRDRETLIQNLKKDIKINGGSDEIFNISYEANDPVVAKNVVQAVLSVFDIQAALKINNGGKEAKDFIQSQIDSYEARLKQAEKAKADFMQANIGLLPDEHGSSINDVKLIDKQLDDANLQFNEALSRKKVLEGQLQEIKDDEMEWIGSEDDQYPEDEIIKELNEKISDLRRKFTDQYPEIVQLKKQIAELEIQRQKKVEERARLGNELDVKVIKTNPYVQSIKIALNQAETEVASAQVRIDELKHRKEQIGNELKSRISIGTALQDLNRDYETIKTNYEKLLASKEQIVMTEGVGDQESLKFKIEDAPNVPLQASSPKRKLLFSAVFAGGIILGLGTAFLLYFIRPAIMSTSQVRQITGLPILGSVSMKTSPGLKAKNKMEFLRYGYSALGLVFIYAGLMVIDILEIKALSLSHWL